MKTTAVFLVLALALLAVPLQITEAKNKGPNDPPEGDLCIRICSKRPEPDHTVCLDNCHLSERGYATLFEKFACTDKCAAQKGIAAPALAACKDRCEKEYEAKAVVITDACNKSCDRSTDKYPGLMEACRKGCKAPVSMRT